MSLEVRVEYADGLKDTELLGKQDPYCVLELGHSSCRTRTCTDGGTRPVWNEALRFNNADPNSGNDLVLTIKNENVMKDDIIGRVVVPLIRVRQTGHESGTYPVLTPEGKQKGTLRLTLTYTAASPGHIQGQQGRGFPQDAAYAQPYQQQQYQQPYPGYAQQQQQPGAYPPPAAGGYPPQGYPPQQQQQQPYQGAPGAYPPPAGYPPAATGYPTPNTYPPQQQQGYPPAAGYPPTPAGYPQQQQQQPQSDPRLLGSMMGGHGGGGMNPLAAGGLGGAAGLVAGAMLGHAMGGVGGHHGGGHSSGMMGMVGASGLGVHGLPYGAGMMQPGGYKHKHKGHKGHKKYKRKGWKGHKRFKVKGFKRKGWK